MPNEIAKTQADEIRLRTVRNHMKQNHDSQVREIQDKNASEVTRTIENHANTIGTLKEAYDVQISQEAAQLEERLNDVRVRNEERIAAEKRAGEVEFEKTRTATREKIEEYQRNGEAKIESLRKQMTANEAKLHEQEKLNARKANMAKAKDKGASV